MKVEFATRKLQKACEDLRGLSRRWGPRLGARVGRRLQELAAFETLEDVPTAPPFRRHQLAANRDEQFAVNLDGKMRLVFDVANDPVPKRADGGIDLGLVTAIRILEVVDYHDD
jgi:proteic killer suppression protein